MKKTNKKGFTIIELVIVIAVIAILAAVLIPTFTSVIKKARINSDTQVVRNLNTSLSASETIDGKPADFNAVMNILKEDGYVLANLNPTTDGWFYVWESETNQMLLVDEAYKVQYKSKELTATAPCATWFFAINDATLADTIKATGANVAYTPKTTENFADVFEAIASANKDQTITIADDLTLGGGFMAIESDASTAKISVDLAGNVVTSAGETISKTLAAGEVSGSGTKSFGQLSAMSGTLNVSNGTIVNNSSSAFAISAVKNGTVNVKNVTINSPAHTGVALRVFGYNAILNAEDTVINVETVKNGGIECGSGVANFKNVTINVNNNDSVNWQSSCIMATREGTINIESGSYTSNGYAVVAFLPTAGTVNISGGTFTATGSAKMFHFFADAVAHKLEITGGTFNGTSWDAIDANGWAVLCGFADAAAAEAANIKINVTAEKVTISKILP